MNSMIAMLVLAAYPSAESNYCPEKLLVHQQVMSPIERPLRPVSTTQEHIFDGVEVFAGPPEYGVQSVVGQQNIEGRVEITWRTDADTWFSCAYRGTSAKVQGQVDPRFKECRFIHDKKNFTRMFRCTE